MATSYTPKFILLAGAVCLAFSTAASAQSAASSSSTAAAGGNAKMCKVGAMDRTFVEKAAMGGMAEVQLSQLAQKNGTSDAVKQYSAKMVEDHTKANDELKQVAGGKSIEVPGALDAKHKMAMAKLEKMSGDGFDRAYMTQMLADHRDTVALFTKEAKSGADADLKAFAAKTLPTLQGHLTMAQTGSGKSHNAKGM